MMQTAQNVADRYELTREEIDAFALRSHQHAAAARDSGRLAEEIHPVEIAGHPQAAGRGRSSTTSASATTPRPRSSRRFPPQPNTTQMTAGNSSPLNDGASAVVLASGGGRRGARRRAAGARRRVGDPRARPAGHGHRARVRDPEGARARRASRPTQIDVWEVHEAYAVRSRSAILRELPNQLDGFEVPDERLNPNGGAVAIGHPFGSSGTRYVLTLATELRERQLRYGVLGVCVGSGQGVALVLENPAA